MRNQNCIHDSFEKLRKGTPLEAEYLRFLLKSDPLQAFG